MGKEDLNALRLVKVCGKGRSQNTSLIFPFLRPLDDRGSFLGVGRRNEMKLTEMKFSTYLPCCYRVKTQSCFRILDSIDMGVQVKFLQWELKWRSD